MKSKSGKFTGLTAVAAVALTSVTTAAFADITFKPSERSEIAFFGTVDFSLAYQSKQGGPGNAYAPSDNAWNGINGGGENMNKFGMKGNAVMSPDYTVGFEFAGTVSTNSGTAGNSQPSLGLFNDRFNVWLKNSYGTFTVGEQMDPAWLATIMGDNRAARQSLDPIAGVWSVAQGTQSSPQSDMKPTNAVSYKNQFGSTSLGILFKPYTNQSGGSGLQNTTSAGGQKSIGLTYNDGTYLATAGYMTHDGIGGSQSSAQDEVKKSFAIGYKDGTTAYKVGIVNNKSPIGIVTGTSIFNGWNSSQGPLNVASEIEIKHGGVTFATNDKNSVNVTYYTAKDKSNSLNTAKWFVVGDNYKLDQNLMIYGNFGIVKAGDGANPLTAGTGPNNVAKPGATTRAVNTGFTYFF